MTKKILLAGKIVKRGGRVGEQTVRGEKFDALTFPRIKLDGQSKR